jgi:hypothetical protein
MDLRNYHVTQISSFASPCRVTLITYNPIISSVDRMCKEAGIEYSVLDVGKDKRVTIRVEKSWLEAQRETLGNAELEALERILATVKIIEARSK